MYMLDFVLRMLGELAGGAVAAVAACWLAWTGFKLVRRPEWGPLLVFVGGIIVVYGRIGASTFIQSAALVSALCAAICWLEGEEWRARHPDGAKIAASGEGGRAPGSRSETRERPVRNAG